jgi:transposase
VSACSSAPIPARRRRGGLRDVDRELKMFSEAALRRVERDNAGAAVTGSRLNKKARVSRVGQSWLSKLRPTTLSCLAGPLPIWGGASEHAGGSS